MLKSCKYCGRIHDSKYDCGKKPTYWRNYTRKEEERGRYTNAWNLKSADIKERSLYLCAECREHGRYESNRLETHHIIPLKERPDLLLEDSNLVCLCYTCHKKADAGLIDRAHLHELARKRDK